MKHLLLILTCLMLATSVNVASAKSESDRAPTVLHSALVDAPQVIDLSRADPTNWPIPSASPSSPTGKGWRYFEEHRIAGE